MRFNLGAVIFIFPIYMVSLLSLYFIKNTPAIKIRLNVTEFFFGDFFWRYKVMYYFKINITVSNHTLIYLFNLLLSEIKPNSH